MTNAKNEEVTSCTECCIPGRREASLGRDNWPEYKKIEEKRLDTGESYRVSEAQSENKTEEKRLGTDLHTEFVQGASKGGSVEDFVCYCSSNILKCYKYL
jgi:hypothetical protein